jgi:hypothetical protein
MSSSYFSHTQGIIASRTVLCLARTIKDDRLTSAASGNVRPIGYIGLLRDLGMPAVVARAVLGG